ncbi:MAG: protocatechuate 3,4-dioxygenase [Pseudomonadota bacterium]|nr:protocatechuate 3,4-dioxygenase [Pseudomonadota bacterium]
MAQLVGAFGMAHVPLISADPFVGPRSDVKKAKHALATFEEIGRRVKALQADTVIVIGDDHYSLYGPHCLPTMVIGTGTVEGPHEEWLGLERAPIPTNQPLAEHLMNYGFDHDFDWTVSKNMCLDHSTMIPIDKTLGWPCQTKVIPVYIAAGVLPVIPTKRCVELGAMIADAVASFPGDDRVVIYGTGGLSHWVGEAIMGTVNEEFDRMLIDKIERNDIDGLVALTDEYVLEHGGNGALEIRNWLVALSAWRQTVGRYDAELLCYEPIPSWITGTTLMEFKAAA